MGSFYRSRAALSRAAMAAPGRLPARAGLGGPISAIIRAVEHLKIAYYFAVLLVGTAAISYTVLMSRAYRLPFLQPFAYFLGFNNLLALINLTSAYACANLLGFCALFQYTVFGSVLGPTARLAEVGIIYALFAMALGFAGRRPSRAFDRWFGAAAALL